MTEPPPDIAPITRLAAGALRLWDLPEDAQVRLLNVSENTTFLVEAGTRKAVLRVHRTGYHSCRAIACELAWQDALRRDGLVRTPRVIPGRDGGWVQQGEDEGLREVRDLVLFEFVEGVAPDPGEDLGPAFFELGQLAARTHAHAAGWQRPEPFERRTWDLETVFGPRAAWGDWRAAPNVTANVRAVLEEVERTVRRRLTTFGRGPDRFGLIHADMRLANLLIGPGGTVLIDFDDCGFSWHLYDFAAAISFIEDDPQTPALRDAWVAGYRKVRPLPEADAVEIPTLVMLRRLALLAWIGSHIAAPEPQAMAPHFAAVSAKLGVAYLEEFG